MISDVINRDNREEEGGNGEELRRTENGKRGKLDWGIKDKFVTKYLLPSLTVLWLITSADYSITSILSRIRSYWACSLLHLGDGQEAWSPSPLQPGFPLWLQTGS
jgi:hypothetical protein